MGDTTSLISAYLLDSASLSATTPDAFGPNTLNQVGLITSVTGIFGNASHFSATNINWDISDAAQVGFDITGDLSIVGWGELSNFTNGNRILCGKGRDAYSAHTTTAGKLRFTANNTQSSASSGGMTLDTWAHLAYVLDTVGDTIKFYIDGSLDTTQTSYTATPTNTGDAFDIAFGNVNFDYWGLVTSTNNNIDEIMVFARTISLAEVQDIKNNGIAAFIGATATVQTSNLPLLGVG